MKKFYSLITMLCISLGMTAQNLSLTVDGEPVENGSTFTKYYASDKVEVIPGVLYNYGIYPEVVLTSLVNGNATVTLESLGKEGDVAFCFGGDCAYLDEKVGYKAEKSKALRKNTAEDLQLHVDHNNSGESTEPYTRELKLTITQKEEVFTCTLILGYDAEKTSIDNFISNKPVVFANNAINYSLAAEGVLEVYSVTGAIAMNKNIESRGNISLTGLSNGLYIYKIKSGGKSYTVKIIIR
ncbi:MAG: T9SS type A sorting domain-containing protein [Bacteroidaceae bacterium]|nr:T9SS type A sorting domain-containing protein [Bacteroidaceae bacterium]